jgi:F0F1-type ATP synthase membrane subunit c/vacuolar-type H+-ATPase subunit K
MTFAGAIVLIGWVVVVLYLFGGLSAAVDGGPAAGVMAALAVTSVVVGEAVGNARRLDCSNPFNLLESYRRRFFLRLAIAEAAALFGFVGFILTNNPVMYLIGALATGVGFYRLAPTHTHLVAESDRMQFDGCQYRLERVLMQRPGTAR